MSDREAVKLLHKEMAGWTIEGIKPSMYPESLAEFHLRLGNDAPQLGIPASRKVVLVCATDLGAWIQDVYDPGKPNERTPKPGTTFEQLVSQIWDYLLDNDCWGNVDPATDEDLPEPSEYLVAVGPDMPHSGNVGFRCPQTGHTWWLTGTMLDAFKILSTPEGLAKVAHLIATETPVDVFRALGAKET